MLESFTSSSTNNIYGYKNQEYDYIIEQSESATSSEEANKFLHQGEAKLINEGIVSPVVAQSTMFAFSKGTSDIGFINGYIDLETAKKTQ